MAKMVRLNQEQREMVESNLALATHLAKRYLSKTDYIKNQDIIQEAVYAMIRAIPTYDPSKAKLSTYLYPTIDGHLKRWVGYRDRIIPLPHQKHLKPETKAKAETAKGIFSLDREIKNSNSNSTNEEITLMDIMPGEVNIEDKSLDSIILSNAIRQLEWREKIVIIYRYYFDLNQTTIGELMGISQVHCHRLEKKALKSLRKHIGDSF